MFNNMQQNHFKRKRLQYVNTGKVNAALREIDVFLEIKQAAYINLQSYKVTNFFVDINLFSIIFTFAKGP